MIYPITEDLNMSVFNMITETNESKMLAKYISFECKSKLDGNKYTSNQKWNNDKCRCECIKLREAYKKRLKIKIITGILLHVVVKMVNIYLTSSTDDSVIRCH